ncbi:Rne/Rng family ribonuclease [Dehalobacter sp. DCM]|uniref:Rne/Rng family ribonuclease n=1 Tax=Dehalobacter sp. DCM TaxID=2907827 RepID=UPI0030821E81|nr:Rne/Rng family ribonuclease [Dehalobacter sp. DCM]
MKEILITTENNQIRAAVLEEGKLVEILDDPVRELRLAGNIYRGTVKNVVSGIQAAFIDIGLDKNAFLYVGDIIPPNALPEPIENVLKEGQEVIVQVTREPIGSKGARVTTQLSLPGRFLVLLPDNAGYLAISQKIFSDEERERLLGVGKNIDLKDAGLIFRTLAEGISEKDLIEDTEKLLDLYRDLKARMGKRSKDRLLYSSSDPFSRLIRETIDEDVTQIIIDNAEFAEILRMRLREVGCTAAGKIRTDAKGGLFERHTIDDEIKRAMKPRVQLKSGGYLVIEKTEAMTVIDINSGKYQGERTLRQTLLNLNLEAASEIARQIRLRNVSGIIIIDFVDMETDSDWDQLLSLLNQLFLKDKVRCQVMGRTKLGLVEVTRKKEGQTLAARYGGEHPVDKIAGKMLK